MEISPKDIENFLNLFFGHQSFFAKQWLNGKGYSPFRPERQINSNDVRIHLSGRSTYGIYPVMEGNLVKLIVFDIDLPKKLSEVNEESLIENKKDLIPILVKIYSTLIFKIKDDKCLIVENTGGRGYHIWLFLNEPISADNAISFANLILKEAEESCEVFPKQSSIGNYGNLIKLPLGIHRKYNKQSFFIDIISDKLIKVENPFNTLKNIKPIQKSLLSKLLKKEYKQIPKPVEETTTTKSLESLIVEIPLTGSIFNNCKALSNLVKKAKNEKHLGHEERLALAYILLNTKDGETILHRILSNCSDYDRKITQEAIDYLKSRRIKPISCRKLINKGFCEKFCRSEISIQSANPDSPEPSPIRFASWGNVYEPESYWKPKELSFENVYSKYNLYKTWEQIKEYVTKNEALIDFYAIENFEEHLDENIETIRYELRNLIYKPSPYRLFDVPKTIENKKFTFRQMSFLCPRDYLVIQAVINVIGYTFEKTFSENSCIGYRLDIKGESGNSIFYSWQSAWQRRKERITRFLFHPAQFHYLKTDILQFYDKINRVRLYNLIRKEIGGEQEEICKIIKLFLENNYIDNSNGTEKIQDPPIIGIPQGPAFSAFFANIYLNELDHLLEKKCFDYVRYVDDMVLLCKSKADLESVKSYLIEYLSSIDLELNIDKTSNLIPVTQSDPLLDFLSEIKYEMTGLLPNESIDIQQITPEFLKEKINNLLNIRKLNLYNLEDISKHLSYYLRTRERFGIEIDNLVIRLSERILTDYVLKPTHLTIVLKVLIKKEVDLTEVLSKCNYPYLKIVLCIILTKFETIPPWIEKILNEFITDNTSYLLRGIAYRVISKFQKFKSCNIETISEGEKSLFVLERFLNYISTIESNKAKMIFLELLEKHFPFLTYEIINSTIRWNDNTLDKLIIDKLVENKSIKNIPIFFIILEFILLTAPEMLEKIITKLISERESLLLRQLVIPSIRLVEEIIIKRNSFPAAFRITINNAVNNIRTKWLKDILSDSVDEWGISEKDINRFLTQEEPKKNYITLLTLSSDEQLKQGGYYSWVALDKSSNKKIILEAIDESILLEQEIIDKNITTEKIKDQLRQNDLSTIYSVTERIEGGKKYHFFEYLIPDGFDILFNVLKNKNIEFDEIEILKIITSLFYQIELVKQYIGIEPVINPSTVIIGEGNQVRLINIFFGIPRKFYISTDKNSIPDISTTTNSFFCGLLMCEMISRRCSIKIYNEIKNKSGDYKNFKDFFRDIRNSLHFYWILDRLCGIDNPEYRYKNINTLKKDVECFERFKNHFRRKDLLSISLENKYWAEVFDVLNLRIIRYLQLPQKQNKSISERIVETFNISSYYISKGFDSYLQNFCKNGFKDLYSKESSKNFLRNLHEAGYKTTLFSDAILDHCNKVSSETCWQINFTIPYLLKYVSIELEFLSLLNNIGLFNLQKKEIRKIINAFIKTYTENILFSTNTLNNKNKEIELIDEIDLLIQRNYKDLISINISGMSDLLMHLLIYLKEKELLSKWFVSFNLRNKINISKIIDSFKKITNDIYKLENILIKILNDPLELISEDDKKILEIYDSIFKKIYKINKFFKINRIRTYVLEDFFYSIDKEVNVKIGSKNHYVNYDKYIFYYLIFTPIWKYERITVDYTKLDRKYFIKSISTVPTRLKNIPGFPGWKYENIFKRFLINIRTHSRNKIWQIISSIIFVLGLLLTFLPNIILISNVILINCIKDTGYAFTAIGTLLLAPVIQGCYIRYKSKK